MNDEGDAAYGMQESALFLSAPFEAHLTIKREKTEEKKRKGKMKKKQDCTVYVYGYTIARSPQNSSRADTSNLRATYLWTNIRKPIQIFDDEKTRSRKSIHRVNYL